MRKTTLSPQSLLPEWFSIKLLVNSDIFKLSLNLSFTHLRALSSCYELRGGLSPVILKEIFHDSLKISKFSRICIENHSRADWVAKRGLFLAPTNPSNFRRLMQSLLLRYTSEN